MSVTRSILLAATAVSAVMLPMTAQAQSVDKRVSELEKKVGKLQKKVYPKGVPADEAGTWSEPAATLSSVITLANRVSALEKQMADIVRSTEDQENRLALIEADVARMKAAQIAAQRNATQLPSDERPAQDNLSRTSTPPAQQPIVENDEPASQPVPAASEQYEDPAEAAYDAGYRLWLARRYDEAAASLLKTAKDHAGHRRESWAYNLAGRAYLDKGDYLKAAEVLLGNYRRDPTGQRAQDSLFYLGQANYRLGQPDKACLAYNELDRVYGADIRSAIAELLPQARASARCN